MSIYKKYTNVQGNMIPFISGSKGCFPKGALVFTPKGNIPIELLKVGDSVYCFNDYDNITESYVEKTWMHLPEETEGYLLRFTHDYGQFTVTDNHYLYDKKNEYKEASNWKVGESLTLSSNEKSKILNIENLGKIQDTTYNLTVYMHHNYICNDIRLSNKGGGKGGTAAPAAREDPNTLFSTDILFLTVALGEGPLYKINPNGPQDIEINEGSIDDLINLDGDGEENTEVFKTLSTTGTITQDSLDVFGSETVTPQSLQNPVVLKKGNVEGIPAAKVLLQDTSSKDWDKLRFNFILEGLQSADANGNVFGSSLTVKITVFDTTGTTEITSVSKTVTGKTNTRYKFQVDVLIPEGSRSNSGYKFTVEKTSDDSNSNRVQDTVSFVGWDEIEFDDLAYPRTAVIGYAIKSFNEYQGSVPTFTSTIKGLLVKVPSNYNQPILSDGEIDWRQLEAPETGTTSIDGISTTIGYTQRGYRLQKTGTGTILYTANPTIYEGIWDGTFVYSWTQNPVWIVYDLLTNSTYGLGIEEENIDKFMFYKVAQYCDACDISTGQFIGVDGFSDGTYRFKPNGLYTSIRETLVGLPRGIQIKERRFITDISIQEDNQVMDTINKITSTFRGLLYYSAGKITLNVDMPDATPVAVFNDANIVRGTLKFQGTRESDIITGVDVSYVEPSNHFKREVIRIDDAEALRERNQIENIQQIDLAGVTRRSQAARYGQYLIASSKFLRRQVEFQTGTEALSLSVGDIVSVSTKSHGVAYGFGGKVASNSEVGSANVVLEHFTVPAITESTITANTLPLGIRIINNRSDRVDFYLASNSSFTAAATGNAESGVDLVELVLTDRFNYNTKQFSSFNSPGNVGFLSNNVPQKGDLWAFGEVDPESFYRSQNDKLFKITELKRDENETVVLSGVEYIPNVYIDSDTLIAYTPVRYDDTVSPLITPPAAQLDLSSRPFRLSDGSIRHDLFVDTYTDTTGYPLYLTQEYEIAKPQDYFIFSLQGIESANSGVLYLNASNGQSLSNSQPSTLVGKNGFKTLLGEVRLLCTDIANINISDSSNGEIKLTVVDLHKAHDLNFDLNILEVNDGTFDGGLKGFDKVTLPVNQKANTGTGLIGFVDHGTRLVDYSANISSYDLSSTSNSISIINDHSGSTTLFDLLPDPPFYLKFNQILDTRYFSEKSVFLEGTSFTDIQSNTITITGEGDFIQPLNISARFKEAVRVFIDGIEINQSDFSFVNSNNNSIRVSGLTDESTIRIETEHYTVPTVELGDNLQFFAGNTYSIVDTSYSTDSPSYNSALTAAGIYRVTLGSNLLSNVSGTQAVNISTDPVGEINNVSENTFTFDYNPATYPGNFSLANNSVYTIFNSTTFDALSLPSDRLIKGVDPGLYVIRSKNVNSSGRKSPVSTDSILISEIPIQKIEEISITESLYIEQTVGVAVRVTISFDHIVNQDITDYEISYRLGGTASDLTTFNTVKVPVAGVDDDGKINFTINNINRGLSSEVNNITVRVTPLNKEIRGVTKTETKTIVGKTAPPLNIKNFSFAQLGENVHLFWLYETLPSGDLVDIDLKEVVIKRAEGTVLEADFEETFVTAPTYVIVSAGSTRKVSSVDTYGTFTYLAKTRDTSGNLSSTTVGVTGTTVKLSILNLIQAYSEDNPTGNVVLGFPNTNLTETNYPSFANSNTGGLSYAAGDMTPGDPFGNTSFDSSIVDNANGTSSGYTVISGVPSDLLTSSNSAFYQTQVRDLGKVSAVSLTANIQGQATTNFSWNNFRRDFASGVSEISSSSNILIDTGLGGLEGIGTVLGFNNTEAAVVTYDINFRNNTLVSGGTLGNVWAIWNEGQFANDFANANSYALIAGVINANAVVLGSTYFANGDPTGSNSFSNLTLSSSAYKLVDLNQYGDSDTASTTFLGDSSALSFITEVRTSTDDPFFANGNVDITTFTTGDTGDRFTTFSTGTRNLRYFQIRHTVTNNNPNEISYTLDKFEYTVDADSKEFRQRVTFDGLGTGGSTFVDYSSINFIDTPSVTMTVVSTSNVLAAPVPLVIDASESGANVNVIFSSNSVPAVGTLLDFIALGP